MNRGDLWVLSLLASKIGGKYTLGPVCFCKPHGCTCDADCSMGHRHILKVK